LFYAADVIRCKNPLSLIEKSDGKRHLAGLINMDKKRAFGASSAPKVPFSRYTLHTGRCSQAL
jgi:hypothetical protein